MQIIFSWFSEAVGEALKYGVEFSCVYVERTVAIARQILVGSDSIPSTIFLQLKAFRMNTVESRQAGQSF